MQPPFSYYAIAHKIFHQPRNSSPHRLKKIAHLLLDFRRITNRVGDLFPQDLPVTLPELMNGAVNRAFRRSESLGALDRPLCLRSKAYQYAAHSSSSARRGSDVARSAAATTWVQRVVGNSDCPPGELKFAIAALRITHATPAAAGSGVRMPGNELDV
jgi:hypothetical protein